MVIGGLLTVLIVFLFLNSWRSTVITGLTLPISVIAAFIAMRLFGFTLNVLTLMGLSLAIGMLIDDAIVVRENIVRHMQRGKDHFDGRARRHGRDRPRGHGHHLHHRGRVHPGGLHGRHGGPVLLRVRHHGGRGRARVAVRELHARPDALVALGRPRRRGGPPATGFVGQRARSASTSRFDALHVRYERLLDWSLRHRWAVLAHGRCVAFLAQLPDPRASWAATSCPTSTAASTRSRSRRRRARRCARPASARGQMVRAAARRCRTSSTPTPRSARRARTYRPVTEGTTYVKLKPARGKTLQRGAARGAPA